MGGGYVIGPGGMSPTSSSGEHIIGPGTTPGAGSSDGHLIGPGGIAGTNSAGGDTVSLGGMPVAGLGGGYLVDPGGATATGPVGGIVIGAGGLTATGSAGGHIVGIGGTPAGGPGEGHLIGPGGTTATGPGGGIVIGAGGLTATGSAGGHIVGIGGTPGSGIVGGGTFVAAAPGIGGGVSEDQPAPSQDAPGQAAGMNPGIAGPGSIPMEGPNNPATWLVASTLNAGVPGHVVTGQPNGHLLGMPDILPEEWMYQMWLNVKNGIATIPEDVITMRQNDNNWEAAKEAGWSAVGKGAGILANGAGNALLGIAKMGLATAAASLVIMNPGAALTVYLAHQMTTPGQAPGIDPLNMVLDHLPIPHSMDDVANMATLGIAGFIDPLKQWVMTGDPGQFQQYTGSFAMTAVIAKGMEYAKNLANCFVAGTPVSTEEGLRPIEAIRPGDRVWAFNHRLGAWQLKTVLQNFVRDYRADMVHVSSGGETIEATMLHPFWVISGKDLSERPIRSHLEKPPEGSAVAGRWVDATDLRAGDQLLLRDGADAVVEKITHVPADTLVYNFAVDELKCYAVGQRQVLVHNINGGLESVAPNTPSPTTLATEASLAEGNAARAAGYRGAASGLATDSGTFTGRSTGAGGGALNPEVQAAYNAVPPEYQSPFHGKCGEGRAISGSLDAGVNPSGGTIVTTTVGGPNHGMPKIPCTSCQWVLNFFGINPGAL